VNDPREMPLYPELSEIEKKLLRTEVNGIISDNLIIWHNQCLEGATAGMKRYNDERKAAAVDNGAWIEALVGNLMWAAVSFIPTTWFAKAVVTAYGTAAKAGVKFAEEISKAYKEYPDGPKVPKNLRLAINAQLGIAYTKLVKESTITANEAVRKIIERQLYVPKGNNVIKRKYVVWEVMFQVPFGPQNIAAKETVAAYRAIKLYDKLYKKWKTLMYENAVVLYRMGNRIYSNDIRQKLRNMSDINPYMKGLAKKMGTELDLNIRKQPLDNSKSKWGDIMKTPHESTVSYKEPELYSLWQKAIEVNSFSKWVAKRPEIKRVSKRFGNILAAEVAREI
jgi:hypothetical protein